MKAIHAPLIIALSVLFVSPIIAEEADYVEPAQVENIQFQEITSDSELYLEEIRMTCQSEAAGLDDADAYVKECIENMKKNFSN